MNTPEERPTLAVWKFASCDGCQLALLDCEDELLTLADRVQIAHFTEATRATVAGPYDVSLVEGSITTPADRDRIMRIRQNSRLLVTIGACASAGGIQALRNFADVSEFRSIVYARPDYIETLDRSLPIGEVVPVDAELRGCPIDRGQLLDLLTAMLAGRRPHLPDRPVCGECKLRGTSCLLVTGRAPCLGPVTRAGCGAICPAANRGCFGCYGPIGDPNTAALIPALRAAGLDEDGVRRIFRTFNAAAPAFADAARGEEGEQR
ncbi:MAG: oxidoreductase [Hamadaea sp.]|uniref:NADH-quinone oxidoreductase subunit B family protein n=1 Tax=Hamadaea sp. TaxID=2024425 RepID=UPI001856D85F|nr:oxidoreductase [Hamadaea sp.]NUT18845.1 oxidoreductase [Hamadaea sp.]